MIRINTFEELINFIENNNLSAEQLNTLIIKALQLWCDKEQLTLPKLEFTNKLKEYWKLYRGNLEKPLFLSD